MNNIIYFGYIVYRLLFFHFAITYGQLVILVFPTTSDLLSHLKDCQRKSI